MSENILVSVLILAYNAEGYIVELLESIKNQTYRDIEIIISDDASKDATVKIAQTWKETNQSGFEKMIIRSSKQNQGVVKNANLGFELCSGRYIKVIAADDKLAPECITHMVHACEEKNYPVLLGRMQSFYQGDDLQDMPVNFEFYDMNAGEQYKHLLQVNECAAPTALYRKDFLKEMDWFDENYPAMEDYPFWLKITEKGVRIPFMNETVRKKYEKTLCIKKCRIQSIICNDLCSNQLCGEKNFYQFIGGYGIRLEQFDDQYSFYAEFDGTWRWKCDLL